MNTHTTQQLQAVIFDMDGVLADSEPHWDNIDADMLRPFGVTYKGEHKTQVLGKSYQLSLQFYKDHYSLPAEITELMAKRLQIAAEYYERHIEIFSEAPATLQALQEMKLKIGVATSSVGALARPFFERHGLTPYFDTIVTGEEIERGKPHPDIYLRAAEKLNLAPAHCIVVEDALAGIEAAKGAGMRVIAIPDARYVDVTLYDTEADYVLGGLGEVAELVSKLVKGQDV